MKIRFSETTKKIFAVVLAVVLVLGALPVSAITKNMAQTAAPVTKIRIYAKAEDGQVPYLSDNDGSTYKEMTKHGSIYCSDVDPSNTYKLATAYDNNIKNRWVFLENTAEWSGKISCTISNSQTSNEFDVTMTKIEETNYYVCDLSLIGDITDCDVISFSDGINTKSEVAFVPGYLYINKSVNGNESCTEFDYTTLGYFNEYSADPSTANFYDHSTGAWEKTQINGVTPSVKIGDTDLVADKTTTIYNSAEYDIEAGVNNGYTASVTISGTEYSNKPWKLNDKTTGVYTVTLKYTCDKASEIYYTYEYKIKVDDAFKVDGSLVVKAGEDVVENNKIVIEDKPVVVTAKATINSVKYRGKTLSDSDYSIAYTYNNGSTFPAEGITLTRDDTLSDISCTLSHTDGSNSYTHTFTNEMNVNKPAITITSADAKKAIVNGNDIYVVADCNLAVKTADLDDKIKYSFDEATPSEVKNNTVPINDVSTKCPNKLKISGKSNNKDFESVFTIKTPTVDADSVQYSNTDKDTKKRFWTNEDVTVSFKLKNFKFSDSNKLEINGVTVTGEDGVRKNYDYVAETGTYSFSADKQQKYTIKVNGIDNPYTVECSDLWLDKTKPEITQFDFAPARTVTDKIFRYLTFGLYSNDSIKVTVKAKDIELSSGVNKDSFKLNVYDNSGKIKEQIGYDSIDVSGNKENGYYAEAVFTLKASTKAYILAAEISDDVGNSSGAISMSADDVTVIVENFGELKTMNKSFAEVVSSLAAPIFEEDTVSVEKNNPGKVNIGDLYSDDVTLSATVVDELSGINSIKVYFDEVSEYEQGATPDEVTSSCNGINKAINKATPTDVQTKITSNEFSLNTKDVFSNGIQSGKYRLRIVAENNSGNIAFITKDISIDRTAPTVEKIEFTASPNQCIATAGQVSGLYYKQSVEVNVTVKDGDIDTPSGGSVSSIELKSANGQTINAKEASLIIDNGDGTYTQTFVIKNDEKAYLFSARAIDAIGNVAEDVPIGNANKVLIDGTEVAVTNDFEVICTQQGATVTFEQPDRMWYASTFDEIKYKVSDDLSGIKKVDAWLTVDGHIVNVTDVLETKVSGNDLNPHQKITEESITLKISTAAEKKGLSIPDSGKFGFTTKVVNNSEVESTEIIDFGVDSACPEITQFDFAPAETDTDKILRYLTFGLYSNDSIKVTVTATDAKGSSDFSGIALYNDDKEIKADEGSFISTKNETTGIYTATSTFMLEDSIDPYKLFAEATDVATNKSEKKNIFSDDVNVCINGVSKEEIKGKDFFEIVSTISDPSLYENIYIMINKKKVDEAVYSEDVILYATINDGLSGINSIKVYFDKVSEYESGATPDEVTDKCVLEKASVWGDKDISESVELNTKKVYASGIESGKFRILIVAENNSGNKSSFTKDIAIDRTAPTVEKIEFTASPNTLVSTDDQVYTGLYSNSAMEAKVTVRDNMNDTPSCGSMSSIGLMSTNGQTINAKEATQIIDNGDGTYTQTFVITNNNATYFLSVNATDGFGNKAENMALNAVSVNGKEIEIADNFEVVCTDKAADATAVESSPSQVKPSIEYINVKGEKWYSGDVTFGFKVTDEFSGIKDINADLTINELTINVSEDLDIKPVVNGKTTSTYISLDTANVIQSLPSGECEFSATVTNNSGNQTTVNTTVYIDTDGPTIESIDFDEYEGYIEEIGDGGKYGYYFKKDTVATVTVTDNDGSGVKQVLYSFIGDNKVEDKAATLNSDGTYSLTIPANSKGYLHVRASDNVDNVGLEKAVGGIVVKEPNNNSGITITLPETEYNDDSSRNNNLYADTINATIDIADIYAGIKTVQLKVEDENKKEKEYIISVDNEGIISNESDSLVDVKNVEKDENLVTGLQCILPVDNNSNDIILTATLTDRAGNTSESNVMFSIDKTAPKIDISYDNNDHTTRGGTDYYKADRTATITVTERNFNKKKTELICSNLLGNEVTLSNWISNGSTHTATVDFSKDDSYSMGIGVTDMANNYTTVSGGNFTIDKTAPIITQFYFAPAGTVTDKIFRYLTFGLYSNDDIKVTVTATDAKGSSDFSGIALYDDDKEIKADAGSFISTKDETTGIYTATSTFTLKNSPNPYKLSAVATDVATNTSEQTYITDDDVTVTVKNFGELEERNKLFAEAVSSLAVPTLDKDTVSVKKNNPDKENIGDLYSDDVTLSATVVDELSGINSIKVYFDEVSEYEQGATPDEVTSKCTGINESINKATPTDVQTKITSNEFSLNTKDVFSNGIPSGRYRLRIVAENNSGNIASYTKDIAIDRTAPTVEKIEFTASPDQIVSTDDQVYTGLYSNKSMEVKVTVRDKMNDTPSCGSVTDISLSVANAQADQKASVKQDNKKKDLQIVSNGDGTYTQTFVITNYNAPYLLSVNATDGFGNKAEKMALNNVSVNYKDKEKDIEITDDFEVVCTDKAADATAVESSPSQVKPSIEHKNVKGEKWYSGDVNLGFTVTDELSGIKGAKAWLKPGEKERIDVSDYLDFKPVVNGKTTSTYISLDTSKVGFDITSGTWKFQATVTNNSGNLTKVTDTVHIDKDKPVITDFRFSNKNYVDMITKDGTAKPVNTSDPDYGKYGFYFEKKTEVYITVDEHGSGVKEVNCEFTNISTSSFMSSFSDKLTTPSDKEEIKGKYVLTIPANSKGILSAYAVDNVDNTSVNATPYGIIVETQEMHDNEPNHIALNIGKEPVSKDREGIDLYDSAVSVQMAVNDLYSGIRSVEYTVSDEFGQINTTTLNIDSHGKISVEAPFAGENWSTRETENNLVTKILTTLPINLNSNGINIQVKLTDRSGNTSEENITFSIDRTAPKIDISYDNNAHTTRGGTDYYKANRTATITVTERNFDRSKVDVYLSSLHGNTPGMSGWSTSEYAGDNTTHTATVVFATDDDYSIGVSSCTDLAKNISSYETQKFTVDKTLPQITLSFDNNSAQNTSYFAAQRTATITIAEHNFDSNDVKLSMVATSGDNSTSVPGPSFSGWTNSGDTHRTSISFTTDGKYAFTIDYSDLADNAARQEKVETFYIDLTKPQVVISNIVKNSANAGEVRPIITLRDSNYSGKYDITINRVDMKAKTESVKEDLIYHPVDNGGTGTTITYDDFIHGKEYDGIYTLSVKMTDRAGNSASDKIEFSVNRFGSTYRFASEEMKSLIDKGYSNKEKDIVIQEINVNPLSKQVITLSKNSDTITTLSANNDYEVKDISGTGRWHCYNYTVKANNFVDEGYYTITVSSVDGAKNSASNRTPIDEESKLPISLVIDKTNPSVEISGIENGALYKESSKEVKIACDDSNLDTDKLVVKLDGKVLVSGKDYTVEIDEIGAVNAVLTVNSTSDVSKQNLDVSIYDLADNEGATSIKDFTLSATWWMRFLANTWLVVGTSIVLVGGIGAGIWLIIKKKKMGKTA